MFEHFKTATYYNAKENPCKDCQKRCAGCHAICQLYLEWQKKHEVERTAHWEKTRAEGLSFTPDPFYNSKKKRFYR